jgi:hypothetical protein
VDQVNVIIDACYSGSFITSANSISRRGRAVLSSAGNNHVAYGSPAASGREQRMYFGEAFWSALDANRTLREAFVQAQQVAAGATLGRQTAWMDDDGNGSPNDLADGAQARYRGLIGSASTGGRAALAWLTVDVTNGTLIVSAQTAGAAERVTVEIARPDALLSQLPGQVNVTPFDQVALTHIGGGTWYGIYGGFNVPGTYTLLATGVDADGSPSQSVSFSVQVGGVPQTPTPVTPTPESHRIFAPLVRR